MSIVGRAAVLVVALASAACGEPPAVLLGTLERDRVELVAEAQEPIVGILVREGEAVEAGRVLLRLDTAAIETRLASARAAARQAERRHEELLTGPRREQLREARALAEGAAARAAAESREFERVAALVEDRLLPANAIDLQRAARDTALAEERAANERLAELEHGTRSEVVAQAAAALDAARAQAAELELSLERHAVRAPRAGVIDALPYELGERPPKGAPVVVMLADGRPYARVFVPEPRRMQVRAGTRATVRLDGSERDWQAEVRYVSAEAAFTPYYSLSERERGRLAFLAEVVLTDPEAQTLPAGMPVEVRLAEAP